MSPLYLHHVATSMNLSLARNPYAPPPAAAPSSPPAQSQSAPLAQADTDGRKLQLSGFGGTEWSPLAAVAPHFRTAAPEAIAVDS